MKTTLDLPAELLDAARRSCNARTNAEAVIAGLTELVRKSKREELRRLAGQVDLEVDLRRSRKRRSV
jgi:hypothetical protein